LKARNAAREKEDRDNWELPMRMGRTGLRNKPGRKPQWKYTKETGAYVRQSGQGGIDWYRYQQVILKPLLLPFAVQCKKSRPNTMVMEDNAPAHASSYQKEVFDKWEVDRLPWPGNSPDLNAIEPTWFHMKRDTTRKGLANKKKDLKHKWIKCWNDIPQTLIQEWIERIPFHIQEVIKLNGGNEYKEGRRQGQKKRRVH
jgi:transposase